MPSSEDNKAVTGSPEPASRKPYVPPRLTSVKLRPEEAVLGGCKTPTGPGTLQSTCALCSGQFIAS